MFLKKGKYILLSIALMALNAGTCQSVVSKKVYNVAEVTYLHSNGDTPAADEQTPDGNPVILPVLSNLCQAKGVIVPADNIYGFRATVVNTAVVLTWRAVTRYTDLGGINVTKYVIYRAPENGSFAVLAQTNSVTLTCTDPSPDTFNYYRVVAVDDMDNTSGYSIIIDNSGRTYVFRADIDSSKDTCTRLIIPVEIVGILYQGTDNDLHIEAIRVLDDEGKSLTIGTTKTGISASFSFDAYRYKNREKLVSLNFPSAVQIIIRYEIDDKGLIKNTTIPANKAKEKLGFYYFNGIEWVKIPAVIDTVNRTLTATVNHLSRYALIAGFSNPTVLTLTKRIPPIITPNSDQINDVCFFYYDNPKGKKVSLKVFDLSGSLVRETQELIAGQMSWDGKDAAGNIMDSGIYVYQIQTEDEVLTGSVVLAK